MICQIRVNKMINQHSVLQIIIILIITLVVPIYQFKLSDNKDNCEIIPKDKKGTEIVCTYEYVAKITVKVRTELVLGSEFLTIFVQVKCTEVNPMVYDILNKLNFHESIAVEFSNCSLPVNSSFGQLFPYLHWLSFRNDIYNSIGPFERKHFGECNELMILSILTNTTHVLANDTFHGMRNLNEVNIGYNIKNLDVFVNQKLQSLELTGNQFDRLTKRSLQGVSQIVNFKMVFDDIQAIDANAFEHMTSLRTIHIESTRIAALPKRLFANNRNISSFIINCTDIDMVILPDELFAYGLQLHFFAINCNLKLIPESLFSNFVSILSIDLSHNKLQTLPDSLFKNIKKLEYLNLNNNLLTTLPDELFDGLDSMKAIILANNTFKTIPVSIYGQTGLINLSYNRITKIDYIDYEKLQNCIQVDLSHNLIKTITADLIELPSAADKYGGNKFNLTSNPFDCSCEKINDIIQLSNHSTSHLLQYPFIFDELKCKTPANMAGRDVSSIQFIDLLCEYSPPLGCSVLTDETQGIMKLNCSNAKLTAVPILPTSLPSYRRFKISALELYIDYNAITELTKFNAIEFEHVTKIIASNNSIEHILPENIPTQLTTLDLSNNRLKVISPATVSTLNSASSLETIFFRGNPWRCDCDELSVKELLSIKRIYDLIDVKCEGGQLATEFVYECNADHTKQTIIAVAGALLFFATLISALIVFYYRNKETILVWLYAHNVCMCCTSEDDLDQDKKYDAFLSFARQEDDFVLDHLLPVLEGGPNPFRICMHSRDWIPGDFIYQQITESVDSSCRTIIVLSRNYLESMWGKMEFRYAHTNAVKDGRTRLIVVMYEDVSHVDDLDPEIKAYLKTNTYLKWGDLQFSDKLRYALPHRRRSSKPNRLAPIELQPNVRF